MRWADRTAAISRASARIGYYAGHFEPTEAMVMTEPALSPPPPRPRKPMAELLLETGLFRARWLLAPVYVGLVVAMAALLVVFGRELIHELSGLLEMTPAKAILMVLSLIDLSLAGNLLLIVIFSGYENFVSKIHAGEDEDRPNWMGTVDFSGLKMKLIASIVAISAIALLRAFMEVAEGDVLDERRLAWLVGIHLTFVVSGVFLAVMDFVASKASKH
jgi:uncharacterized protein (TIGR00645 family)